MPDRIRVEVVVPVVAVVEAVVAVVVDPDPGVTVGGLVPRTPAQ